MKPNNLANGTLLEPNKHLGRLSITNIKGEQKSGRWTVIFSLPLVMSTRSTTEDFRFSFSNNPMGPTYQGKNK